MDRGRRAGPPGCTINFEIEFGIPIQVPMQDIRTIGAGGGSIARINRGGMFRVGPRRAGARPEPACCGLGGSAATLTGANLVFGRIRPHDFRGGEMPFDPGRAQEAVARANPLSPGVGEWGNPRSHTGARVIEDRAADWAGAEGRGAYRS